MNYAIVAFAIVIIVSIVQWIVDGRKHYQGPRVEMEGIATVPTHTSGQGANGSVVKDRVGGI